MIRPRLWRAYLIFIGVTQLPIVVWLVMHAFTLQLLAATTVGALLGRALRPLASRQRWVFLPVGLAVLACEVQLGTPAWMLLDQVFKVTLIVSTWPGDPGGRVRRRWGEAVREIRRWSTGMPTFRWTSSPVVGPDVTGEDPRSR